MTSVTERSQFFTEFEKLVHSVPEKVGGFCQDATDFAIPPSANWNFCAISIFDLIASKELADPIGRSEFRFEAEEGFFFRIGAKERDHFGTERRQAMLGPTEDGFRDLLEKTDSMVDQKTQSPCAV